MHCQANNSEVYPGCPANPCNLPARAPGRLALLGWRASSQWQAGLRNLPACALQWQAGLWIVMGKGPLRFPSFPRPGFPAFRPPSLYYPKSFTPPVEDAAKRCPVQFLSR